MNYNEVINNFDLLYNAFLVSKNRRSYKKSAMRFELDAVSELKQLQQELISKTYKVSGYNEFRVTRPKERTIKACMFRDKVVQHLLCDNILIDILPDVCITDNYSGQPGKGTGFAYKRTTEIIRDFYDRNGESGYLLKCDVRKYYYNIRHDKAVEIMCKYAPEDKHWLIKEFVTSTEGDVGIALGNQINTIVSNLYLDGMDKFITNELGILHYGRYADDFYLIHESKEYLTYCLSRISEYLRGLGLELNEKSQVIPCKNGISFCGFHFYMNGEIKLVNSKKRDYRRKFNKMCNLVSNGRIPIENLEKSYLSYKEHAKLVTNQEIFSYYDKKLKELRQCL